LADARVWEATHRMAGPVFVGGGLLALLATMVGPSISGLVVIGATVCVPAIYSLILYKHLNPAP
jgi:uncharacterized membrane protein